MPIGVDTESPTICIILHLLSHPIRSLGIKDSPRKPLGRRPSVARRPRSRSRLRPFLGSFPSCPWRFTGQRRDSRVVSLCCMPLPLPSPKNNKVSQKLNYSVSPPYKQIQGDQLTYSGKYSTANTLLACLAVSGLWRYKVKPLASCRPSFWPSGLISAL